MALARGAALASANAPLFASSTAALAYALDPGTGELTPPALTPTYLDVWGHADVGTGARAYSAVADDEEKPRRRPWSMLLAGSALVGIVAAVGGVVLVTLTADRPGPDVRHNSGVGVATPGVQLPAPPPSNPPSNPPQAPPPPPSAAPPPPPAPAPSPSEVAAPAPAPPPVQQAAPQQTPVNPPPAAPVRRAPTRPAPQYAPPPVEQAAPPPAAAPAPPPAAPPPAPAAPQLPQQPPVTMYLHFPFVTVPIPITPPPPPAP
jgi:hypothetical protein